MQFTCKANASVYAKILFKEFFKVNWFWFILPLAFFGCLSVVDVRFVIVACMVLLVVIPMVMSLLYINYMMTLSTRWSIVKKMVCVMPGALRLVASDGRERNIPFDTVRKFFLSSSHICLELRERRYQYLIIPVSVFEEKPDELHGFLSLLKENIA